MSKVDQLISRIEQQQLLGISSKKVLLVEGDDDITAFTNWLTNKFGADWESSWVVFAAGQKSMVLKVLEIKEDWIGVIDRDEWSSEKIQQLQENLPNVFPLPRYCIENYLVVPSELWLALPDIQQQKLPGGEQQLEEAITSELGLWLKHGALWSVVNPLWEGLKSRGFKDELLSPSIADDQDAIRHKLQEWHEYLDPETIMNRYLQRYAEIESETLDIQLCLGVHGKKFYDSVVNTALNRLLGQQGASERQREIIRGMSAPDDLEPLWQKMQLT